MDEPRAVGVSVRNLSKSYGKVQALRKVSLEVPPGSFTTLLGPSGCGKTTLLRCIAGLEERSQAKYGSTTRWYSDERVPYVCPRKPATWVWYFNHMLYGLT